MKHDIQQTLDSVSFVCGCGNVHNIVTIFDELAELKEQLEQYIQLEIETGDKEW